MDPAAPASDVPPFVLWVRRTDGYLLWHSATGACSEAEAELLPEGINSFYLPKAAARMGAESEAAMLEQFRLYAAQLVAARWELMHSPALPFRFDYFQNDLVRGRVYCQSHNRCVRRFMAYYTACKGFAEYEPVMWDEYQWFRKCQNGGLMYLRAPGEYRGLHGRDYKMSYPSDMSRVDYMIPTRPGRAVRLKELPEWRRIQFGIYRARIACADPRFCAVFMYSRDHYYTSYSLKFALKHGAKYGVSVELLQDGEPNAYRYAAASLVRGCDVFGGWRRALQAIKAVHPQNCLVKLLASSAWGGLQQLVCEYKTEAEMAEFDATGYETVDLTEKRGGDLLWTLVDTSRPVYKSNLRLLPFITSYSRCKVAALIEKHNLHDGLVRIQTDSITLDRPFPFPADEGFVDDDKISGDMRFHHLNSYERL